jgi:hypothetical protein
MDSAEFREQESLRRREQLINAQIQVNVPQNVTPVAGVPEEHLSERRVRIFKQAKNVMQSATFDTKNWKIGMIIVLHTDSSSG